MPKTKLHVVEVVPDADLWAKEGKARAAAKRFFPNAVRMRLYRTANGWVGCQLDVTVTSANRYDPVALHLICQISDAALNGLLDRFPHRRIRQVVREAVHHGRPCRSLEGVPSQSKRKSGFRD